MKVYVLWEMCQNMVCKYDCQMTLRLNFGNQVHKVKRSFVKIIHINWNQPSKCITTRKKTYKEDKNMVGERNRREPKDEAKKCHQCSKVWSILKKGDITTFIQ